VVESRNSVDVYPIGVNQARGKGRHYFSVSVRKQLTAPSLSAKKKN
jgi:hypothetical protein